MHSTSKVTHNFINKYGIDKFWRLVDLLSDGTSGQAIADEFKVSRERVRQWKGTFGNCFYIYMLKNEVKEVINEYERNDKSSS